MIAEVYRPNRNAEQATHEVLVSETDRSGYVLVVDDDDGICEVMCAILSDAGYEAECARSAGQAIQRARERQPGLILLDISVGGPIVDELVAACRQSPTGPPPIVVMSGHPRLRELAAAIGADAVLEKPFDVLVLLDIVEAAFGQ
jgi:CheY-like chemotaxis protein